MTRGTRVRDLEAKLERSEGALAKARSQQQLVDQIILHSSGPFKRFVNLYAQALIASDPVKGRELDPIGRSPAGNETGLSPAFVKIGGRLVPVGEPEKLREWIDQIDTLLINAADSLAAALGDEVDHARPRDICAHCGQRVWRTKLHAAHRWLEELVREHSGRIESTAGMKIALEAGHTEITIRRALRHKRSPVKLRREGQRWMWVLR